MAPGPVEAEAGAPGDVAARVQAVHDAYPGVWEKFLQNRWPQAAERAEALLRVLGAAPAGAKDFETWAVEADLWYILGAARGNAAEELGRALAAYDSSLAAPGGATNASARRMSAEALLRLGRYEEAFGVFSRLAEAREAAAAWEDPGWGSLEVPPFRLRHDAALCARLASLGRLDAAAAEEAAAALEEVAGRVEARCGGDCRRYPELEQLAGEEVALLRRGLFDDLGRSSAGYPAARLAAWSGAGGCPPDPLNASVDWAAVSEEYLASQLVVVDDFFAPEALEELWAYACEAPCFRTVRNGFLGAFPGDGNVHPVILSAARSLERRMSAVLRGHPLGLWWLFKYTASSPNGIAIHADVAAVNVNVWLTPDSARKTGGGLDVYMRVPPTEAGVAEFNREFASRGEEAAFREVLLAAGPVRHVGYRRNRAAIFVSDLFHASEPFEFADAAREPRVNLTLLFGDRAAARRNLPTDDRGLSFAGAAGGAAEGPARQDPAGAKRPLEPAGPDWDDLFG